MKNTLILTLICLVTACIPDNVKKEMSEGLSDAQQMVADMEFKKAIAQIELHRLRYGHYPDSLSELKFLSSMDSSMISNVDYTRLDSVYELNLKMESVSLDSKETTPIKLKYPAEFWAGLGCVKSNVK
ncbi:MAG: hypothetical protein J7604_24945 [Sporocytophaga sp.]|uniref:hypothetical protein n=1 Tax=Sporocytophaga sp. TaxID=2231183 RepID=UPI001B0EF7FD|nr:hypothetical protein [Sporocytophaga sp.]MBO9703479.1 hypothetical protein [Sporocytophaga sp.]